MAYEVVGIQEGRIMPDVEVCPCCGADTRTTKAECDQAHGNDGRLLLALLFWRCQRCDCRWKHGQFEQTKGGARENEAAERAVKGGEE
jgi:uncharacterized protein with PIN domain